jgi:hypothetical protein
MTRELAVKKLRLWYGWHGYTEAEREVHKFTRRLNVEKILEACLAYCPKMPPKPYRRRR